MKWIREYFVKNALEKPKKKKTQKSILLHIENIKTIAILGNNKDEIDQISEVIHRDLNEKIKIMGNYYDEKSEDQQAFSYKDFTLIGKPGEKLNQLLSLQPDLIIFTSEKLNYFTLYLLQLQSASYSMGFFSEELKPYLDLMLNEEEKDIQSGTASLIKYLKQIN
ncbi:DUF6913 domain-containing protein [Cyclobacterium jeungdonense]|uniref:Iron complex transport system substrate-binding protein n=1 Tax=Cyclobacterium jeungdonense TaxID=708087 RepID=A0ABT8CBV3_9BACT|nr:hypothetical protein [Cyclobacterium jeungdonense]MDN3690274.1 hypothetical protein [Cyclobacterium jeungdonense]